MEGTATGAGIGGTLGAIIGAIAAIGTSVLLPGLGLLVAGPIAGALVGAGAGGITGGLLGALVGSGIPEEHAAEYETGIKSGGTVLGVNPRSAEDATFLEREFTNCGGTNVYSSGGATTQATSATAHNVASTNTQTATTDRSHTTGENVIPVNRDVTQSDLANFKEGDINVTTRAEEAVVAKQARVVEEVEIGKTVSEREQTVRDTVRRTDVEVEEIDTNITHDTDAARRKSNS
jgi:hypothetical protein